MPIKPVAKTAGIAAGVATLLVTTAAILVGTTAIEPETDKVGLVTCGASAAGSVCKTLSGVSSQTTDILADTADMQPRLVDVEADVAVVDTVVDLILIDTTKLENHIHDPSLGFGLAAAPAGETHRADRIGTGIAPFRVDASNDNWGADGTDDTWLQIMGSNDTAALFGADRVTFIDHERLNSVYFIRVAWGASGAAALAAGDVTESILRTGGGNSETVPVELQIADLPTGTKIWIQVLAYGLNTGWLDFYMELQDHAILFFGPLGLLLIRRRRRLPRYLN